jgi:hypothetical protein
LEFRLSRRGNGVPAKFQTGFSNARAKSVFEKSSLEFRLQAAGREKPHKRGTPNATGRVRSDFPNTR